MEYIDIKYFKKLGIYSLILGGISGVISTIPILLPFFAVFFLPWFGALIPIILLVKEGFCPNEVKTFAIFGGLSGFAICTGFLFTFVPLVFIIHLINKNYYDYGIQGLNLFLICLFFVMIAMVYIIPNAVLGLIAGSVYKYFKGKNNG